MVKNFDRNSEIPNYSIEKKEIKNILYTSIISEITYNWYVPLCELSVFIESIKFKHYESEYFLKRSIDKYKNFRGLYKYFSKEKCALPVDIYFVWISHMMSPRDYWKSNYFVAKDIFDDNTSNITNLNMEVNFPNVFEHVYANKNFFYNTKPCHSVSFYSTIYEDNETTIPDHNYEIFLNSQDINYIKRYMSEYSYHNENKVLLQPGTFPHTRLTNVNLKFLEKCSYYTDMAKIRSIYSNYLENEKSYQNHYYNFKNTKIDLNYNQWSIIENIMKFLRNQKLNNDNKKILHDLCNVCSISDLSYIPYDSIISLLNNNNYSRQFYSTENIYKSNSKKCYKLKKRETKTYKKFSKCFIEFISCCKNLIGKLQNSFVEIHENVLLNLLIKSNLTNFDVFQCSNNKSGKLKKSRINQINNETGLINSHVRYKSTKIVSKSQHSTENKMASFNHTDNNFVLHILALDTFSNKTTSISAMNLHDNRSIKNSHLQLNNTYNASIDMNTCNGKNDYSFMNLLGWDNKRCIPNYFIHFDQKIKFLITDFQIISDSKVRNNIKVILDCTDWLSSTYCSNVKEFFGSSLDKWQNFKGITHFIASNKTPTSIFVNIIEISNKYCFLRNKVCFSEQILFTQENIKNFMKIIYQKIQHFHQCNDDTNINTAINEIVLDQPTTENKELEDFEEFRKDGIYAIFNNPRNYAKQSINQSASVSVIVKMINVCGKSDYLPKKVVTF
ncbi:hypothetical protein A3Q56_04168 [Intoshia linei]|uniref:Uncharacterized protein n=1 Tax=Intoshia linei TaxID=1819745 RepID=A0A177B1E8_9BILA|nr:hypothetical protein A3Q56_04168 [Intoshia linei]